MARYFLEVAYKGTRFSGFQIQENATTIQAEIENALQLVQRQQVLLTGSSRTDAGVHACQNFFHFDIDQPLHPQLQYKLNAILPRDIVVKHIRHMHDNAHARFDALSREYIYKIHKFKDPFLQDTSYYFPYHLNLDLLKEGAALIKEQTNFYAFAKTNSQVKNYNCTIKRSQWLIEGETLMYNIEANRFLRGMVRLITGSLLKLGREKITLPQLKDFFSKEVKSGYSVPSQGLYLKSVNYPEG